MKHRLYIDLPEGHDMKGITLGEEVTVMAKGKIKSARAEEEEASYPDPCCETGKGDKNKKKKYIIPAEITLELTDVKIKGKNVFEELSEDDD